VPVIGIGASPGGLEALEQLFSNMPANPGMSFIVITHLDRTHISMLPSLLEKYTEMPYE
jgi:two-component system CheB/CheR fusion protein